MASTKTLLFLKIESGSKKRRKATKRCVKSQILRGFRANCGIWIAKFCVHINGTTSSFHSLRSWHVPYFDTSNSPSIFKYPNFKNVVIRRLRNEAKITHHKYIYKQWSCTKRLIINMRKYISAINNEHHASQIFVNTMMLPFLYCVTYCVTYCQHN